MAESITIKETLPAIVVAVRSALREHGGLSAATIASVLVPELRDYADGMAAPYSANDHPHDPDDFSRCRRILALIPNGVSRLDEIALAFPKSRPWARLAAAWPELEAMFMTEEARGWEPPFEMYARMKQLIAGGSGK